MWQWCDKLKLGKSSAFVKRNLRSVPLADVACEADFFLDAELTSQRQERWLGMVMERESGAVLALEDVQLPPPTVNGLANLLAHAMLRPLNAGHRQRPRTIYLRDRPQWLELLPHIRQLGIEVVLGNDLPRFDEAVIDWMRNSEKLCAAREIRTAVRMPFPERKRTWFTHAMDLMEWTDAMIKGAYPSRTVAVPAYDPTAVVPIYLTADELETILTQTRIARTKKLRPRLEAMAVEGKAIELDINDWSSILLALCGARVEDESVRRRLLKMATGIANHLAEVLEIDAPSGKQ